MRPTLAGEKVVLRPLQFGDAEALWEAFGDAATMRYWSRGPLESVDALRHYMRWNVESPDVIGLAITRKKQPKALGWVALIDQPGSTDVEVGIILIPGCRGQGLAKEAIELSVTYLQQTRPGGRLIADIDPENLASIALFERAGFHRVEERSATIVTHLGVRDSVIYAWSL